MSTINPLKDYLTVKRGMRVATPIGCPVRVTDTVEQPFTSLGDEYEHKISAEIFTLFIGEPEAEGFLRAKALRELNRFMFGGLVQELSAIRRELHMRREHSDIADRLQGIIEELV